MKTKTELHPVLQELRDALPERMQKVVSKKHSREHYLDLPHVGFATVTIYDELAGVSLCFSNGARARNYPVRKDGTINIAKIVEVVTPIFDRRAEFHRHYEERQRESKRHSIAVEEILAEALPKMEAEGDYSVEDDRYLIGGFLINHKGSGRSGQMWIDEEGNLSGMIPVGPISVEQFNKALKLLGAL